MLEEKKFEPITENKRSNIRKQNGGKISYFENGPSESLKKQFIEYEKKLENIPKEQVKKYESTNKKIADLRQDIKDLKEIIKDFKTKSADLKKMVVLEAEIKMIKISIDEELKKNTRASAKIKARDERIAGYNKEIEKIQKKIDKIKLNKNGHFDSLEKMKIALKQKEEALENLTKDVTQYNKLLELIANLQDTLKDNLKGK